MLFSLHHDIIGLIVPYLAWKDIYRLTLAAKEGQMWLNEAMEAKWCPICPLWCNKCSLPAGFCYGRHYLAPNGPQKLYWDHIRQIEDHDLPDVSKCVALGLYRCQLLTSSCLLAFHNVKWLDLKGCGAISRAFGLLPANLDFLGLSYCSIGDCDFTLLKGVKSIDLSMTNVNDISIKALYVNSKPYKLDIGGTKATDKALLVMKGYIRELFINGSTDSKFTDEGLKHIGQSVEVLDIFGNGCITDEGIRVLTKIKYIDISYCRKIGPQMADELRAKEIIVITNGHGSTNYFLRPIG
jgi:Leucine Rich repeat